MTYEHNQQLTNTLSSILINRGDRFTFRAQIELIDSALRSNGDNALLWYTRGLFFQRNKDPVNSLVSYQKALELNPTLTEAQLNSGFIHYENSSYKEAESTFQDLIARDPEIAMAHYGLGLVNLKSARRNKSREHFATFLKLSPDGVWAEKARSFLKQLEQTP